MTTFLETLRCIFPHTLPLSEHAWIRASGKASASRRYVIQICVSVVMRTGKPIKDQMQSVTCLAMTTRSKFAADS